MDKKFEVVSTRAHSHLLNVDRITTDLTIKTPMTRTVIIIGVKSLTLHIMECLYLVIKHLCLTMGLQMFVVEHLLNI